MVRNQDLDFDINEVLSKPLFAHLAAESSEGPRESPLWFIGSSRDSFPKRIAANNRCAVGIVDFDLPGGFLRHVGFRGHAVIEELNQARLIRFLSRYIGSPAQWNPKFKKDIIDGLDLMIKFTPKSIVARDQSYFK